MIAQIRNIKTIHEENSTNEIEKTTKLFRTQIM